ncbi:bifunctional 3-deoxy-7-phosphoheptulonate synthase/chorismate mutase [Ligaoa zhengdingensis]|uniref:bifunctional 3-deoxy-7-phosphoheptulonate synthase/chorismate mutase n=1 Tax=Ligaoa zhengdingensis TaxID=2763658 RepID=UPI0020165C6B|nr:bifunctional 3-deoxy-7-phosphoheptulonate synthase/chorismate mutase [Ligaoa zhengdingensis]
MNGEKLLVQELAFPTINELFGLPKGKIIVAGPCAVESEKELDAVARSLKECGVRFLRGGAFKPRTSPYDFQGLGEEGMKIIDRVRRRYDMLAVSEIMDVRDIELGMRYTDVIQVGARNMQNFSLLKELGRIDFPVVLKRGMMTTVREFLLATEYIVSGGNQKVILCERGIRTFEDSTRNTLDIACIPLVKTQSSLPILVDLSHSLGRKDIALPVARAALACGADGLMLEVHNHPRDAKCDKAQQMDLTEFRTFLEQLNKREDDADVIAMEAVSTGGL